MYGLFTERTKQKATQCLNNDGTLNFFSRTTQLPDNEVLDAFILNEEPIDGYYYYANNQATYFCRNGDREELMSESERPDKVLKTIGEAK